MGSEEKKPSCTISARNMILFAMASLPPLGIYSLLVHFSIYGKVGQAFPCGEVCECYDQQQHFVADCSGRNLRFLPLRLPKETQYLDFSGNALSTLFPQIIAHLPRSLLVLDLSNNPLRCDDQTLRRLKSSVSVRDNCLEASLSAGFSNSEKSLLHRSKRAVTANGECKIGSSNCVKHICGGFEYWLPYATYWGCCQGKIHDLRKTYCSKIQGVQPCNHTMYNQSKCSNGHCVPENWKCNKMNDCQDGSDEVGCDQCKESDNFRCRNGRCVPQSVVCDAYNDCGDGSDETFCRTLNGGWCKTDEYRCPTDVCIPVSAVCDGSNDCADYSDEIGCKEIRTCHVLGAGRDCRGNFEKPKMTSFPREEILSVSYDSEVNVECKATGFPRPSVMLFINALRAYTIASARSMMAPYEANVTLVVKMTSEVECHVTNRLGSSVVRMRIVMKDDNSAFLKAVLRLKEFSFTAKLKDPMSQEFKMLADTLEKKMMQVYREVKDVRDVNVVSFSEGSVVADFILYTVKDTSSDLEGILDSAVKTRTFGEAVIDSFGKAKACPKEFFNVTWSFTFEGQYATQVCPRGAKGMSKRKCLENGVWGYPDYGQCTSQEFSQLNDKIDVMSNSSRPSNNQVTRVILELSLLTKPKKYDAVMAGDIKISTQILRKVVNYNEKFSNGRETETANIEGFLQTVSNLLDANNIRDFSQLQKTDKTATDLTKVTEDYGLQTAAGQKNTNDEYRVVKDNIAMEAKLVANDAQGPLTFPGNLVGLLLSPLWANSGKQCITLPKALFNKNSNLSANGTKVASFLFRTLDSFLTQESAYEIVGQQFEVESRVIASSVEPPAGKLAEPVVIVFGGFQDDHRKAVCVYWDYYLNSRGGGWSTDGCWLASRDSGTITCKCDHLTNFAILMDTSGISSQHSEHSKTLSYITLIGCCLSLLGIIITLALHFVLWRILKSPKTVIHVNLCSTLLIANILLLVGSAATKYKILCTVVSVLLHYFFLSAILWMLAEGLQIYSAIVKVFDGEGKLKYFYILGWGVPLIIVLPCLVITRTVGYGENRTCWLSIRSGLIWTFIGPALTVVLINSIIFLLVLRAMMTSHKMIGASDKEKIKLGIKCSVVLIPLLGISWVFGVIAFDQDTVIFLYLFAVFNSLQGFFISIFHCVLDQQVRAAIRIWRNKRQRKSYASAVDTTPKCQTAHKKHKTNRV